MDIGKALRELRGFYAEVDTKQTSDGNTLVRIRSLTTHTGCNPGTTDFLLVLSPQQEAPVARYVKHPVTLASGNTPNYSSALVDGETWYTFSYNIRWNPSDPLYLYVESAMTRFAKTN